MSFPEVQVQAGGDAPVALHIDGRAYPPLFFAMNNQFDRDALLVDGLRIAAAEGVPLYTYNLMLAPWHTPEQTRETIARFAEAHPNGYYLVRVWLGPTEQWRRAHPDDVARAADGTATAWVSLASGAWREDTATRLRALIDTIASTPHAARFIGVMLTYLQTGEWFPFEADGFYDYSPVNRDAFRTWSGRTLGAGLEIPTPEARQDGAWGLLRDPQAHAGAVAYDQYFSTLVAETIGYFARVVKDATGGRALAGAFYGYTFELNHNGPRALGHSGHAALAQLQSAPEIDFVAAPYAYFERDAASPGHFHLPLDSPPLHGRLVLLEDDTFTHLARMDDTLTAPGWEHRALDMDASLALASRNATNFATHRAGWWLFDLLSDGRWNDARFWQAMRPQVETLAEAKPFAPRIAVAVSEASLAYCVSGTHPELLDSIALWRHEFARLGEPVGYYLQSDVARLPASVQLLILPNAYRLHEDEKRAIDALVARGGCVVWTYASGVYTDATRNAPLDAAAVCARVAACTGFPVVEAGPGPITLRLPNGDLTQVGDGVWRARLALVPGNFEVLAHYADTGAPAVAVRPEGRGRVVYTAVPRLPVPMLRALLAN